MTGRCGIGLLIALFLFLIQPVVSGHEAVSAQSVPTTISVQGNAILRDGQPWIARGVILAGFVAPKADLRPAYKRARAVFGPQLIDRIKEFGADTVRIHVSQPALDPKAKSYDSNYKQEYIAAVNLARSEGLVVIVSMQWQRPTGHLNDGMPSAATRRAWAELVPVWANDRGVIYNVFNEPELKSRTSKNWKIWQDTHQETIDLIRSLGSRNVLIVDGLRGGHYLEGAPPLHDPLNQIIYGAHPFPNKETLTRKDWDRDWGNFAQTRAVMVTAWNALTSRAACKRSTPEIAADFLQYLKEKRIGLIVWAFDMKGTIVRDFETFRPVSYDDFSCESEVILGPGQLVFEHFQTTR